MRKLTHDEALEALESAVVTPVEERIDHEEAEKWARSILWSAESPMHAHLARPALTNAARAYLALLIEHSALREQNDRYFAYFKGHPERWAELGTLPATEPAQPEPHDGDVARTEAHNRWEEEDAAQPEEERLTWNPIGTIVGRVCPKCGRYISEYAARVEKQEPCRCAQHEEEPKPGIDFEEARKRATELSMKAYYWRPTDPYTLSEDARKLAYQVSQDSLALLATHEGDRSDDEQARRSPQRTAWPAIEVVGAQSPPHSPVDRYRCENPDCPEELSVWEFRPDDHDLDDPACGEEGELFFRWFRGGAALTPDEGADPS